MNSNLSWIYVLPIISMLFCWIIWRLYGRDDSVRKTVIAEYNPPADLSPAEVGLIYDFKATDREVSSTLVDLAVRGYLNIIRAPRNRMMGSYFSYEFELLNDNVLELRNHEKALLDGLFGVTSVKRNVKNQSILKNQVARNNALTAYPASTKSFVGAIAYLDELQPYFFRYVTKAKTVMYANLRSKEFFKKSPLDAGALFYTIGFILTLMGVFTTKNLPILLLSALIYFWFGYQLRARTRIGSEIKNKVDGFRLYIQTVDSNKLKSIQGPDTAAYDANRAILFEKYLGYAIALGVESEWTKQFEDVYTQPAGWLGHKPINEVARLIQSIQNLFSD